MHLPTTKPSSQCATTALFFNTVFIAEVSLWMSCCFKNFLGKHLKLVQNCYIDWINEGIFVVLKVAITSHDLTFDDKMINKMYCFPDLIEYRSAKEIMLKDLELLWKY